MRNKYLQQQIVFGRLSLPLAIIVMIVLAFFVPETSKAHFITSESTSLWDAISKYITLDALILRIVNIAIFTLAGLFLLVINNTFALIRVRSTIPATLFFVMLGTSINLHSWQPSPIVMLLMSFSLYFLLGSYQEKRPMGNIYHAWGLLGFASILFPDLIMLIPIYLIGEYMFQSLSIKSFFSGIMGLCVPYLLIVSYAFIFNQMWLIDNFEGVIDNFSLFDFSHLNLSRELLLGYVVVTNIIAIIHLLLNNWKDKIKTRDFLFFIIWLSLFLLALTIIRPQNFDLYYSLLLITSSILIGHFLALTNNKAINILFLSSIFILTSIYIYTIS
jgi:hypothetical protein